MPGSGVSGRESEGGRAELIFLTAMNSLLQTVYRYVPGAIYRPHIDGAWPASGVDPVTVGSILFRGSALVVGVNANTSDLRPNQN